MCRWLIGSIPLPAVETWSSIPRRPSIRHNSDAPCCHGSCGKRSTSHASTPAERGLFFHFYIVSNQRYQLARSAGRRGQRAWEKHQCAISCKNFFSSLASVDSTPQYAAFPGRTDNASRKKQEYAHGDPQFPSSVIDREWGNEKSGIRPSR